MIVLKYRGILFLDCILFDLELNDQQTTKTDEFYGDKKSNPVDNHLQDGIEKVKS